MPTKESGFVISARLVCVHTFCRPDFLDSCTGSGRVDAESTILGTQANIPARVGRALDIDDGDRLRWHVEDDGTLRVEVVQQRNGTFSDFGGYDGDREMDVTTEHDAWGVDMEMPRALVTCPLCGGVPP